tara:strand:- start:496 stop:708 length:213 start_codon:yes stop_codon:yes gene_type:complete
VKELQKVEDAISETRKLFNDLNTIRDRSKLSEMQGKTMNVMNCLMDLRSALSTFDDRLSKLEKIEKILAE